MAVAVVGLVGGFAPARAQHLTFYAGETRYELGDLGPTTSWVGGVATGWAVNKFLRTGVTFLAWDYEGGSLSEGWSVDGTRVAAEVGFYLQPQRGWLRPYAGGGTGVSVSRRRYNEAAPTFSRVSGTAHAALGTDVGMGRSWSLRTEIRLRDVVGTGSTSDLTVGLSRRRR